ncbi:unnamed protein product [Protopolystoma xenopodis]|uniref:Protein kinase domain-containing protein n=1 Tax=Protopolystoma xenopodis TaxID=117903 RepID=A0A448WRS1_9PLAT|nr:unnamed protein product [Protopolystoma xenopodis]
MLEYDPADRISLAAAIQHPFFLNLPANQRLSYAPYSGYSQTSGRGHSHGNSNSNNHGQNNTFNNHQNQQTGGHPTGVIAPGNDNSSSSGSNSAGGPDGQIRARHPHGNNNNDQTGYDLNQVGSIILGGSSRVGPRRKESRRDSDLETVR